MNLLGVLYLGLAAAALGDSHAVQTIPNISSPAEISIAPKILAWRPILKLFALDDLHYTRIQNTSLSANRAFLRVWIRGCGPHSNAMVADDEVSLS